MSTSTNLIKEAERNCINISKELSDMLEVLQAMSSFGNRFFEYDTEEKTRYFSGLAAMRSAVYSKYIEMLSRCFVFSGVGGKDSLDYSKKKFNEYFNGDTKYAIMQFLDKDGRHPGSYLSKTEEKFREQARSISKK